MDKTNLGNKKIFSNTLLRQLARTNKTQKEVAAAIGVTSATICDWINLRSYPRMEKVERLADYFGISKIELLEDINVEKETISDEEQKVLDLFHKVPKEKREFVLSLIQATIDNLK